MPTYTFYPDPDTETSSVDGEITSGTAASFTLVRDATTGTATDNAATLTIDVGRGGGGNYSINRLFLLFDTSSIVDSETVTAATLSLNATSTINSVNDGNDYVSIITTNPASNTALASGDYDNIEGTDNNNPLGTGVAMKEMHTSGERKDITSISTGSYTVWNLNSTGLGYVSKTGVSKFGAAVGYDVTNTAYPGGAGTNESVTFKSAEHTGTGSDPELFITTTAATGQFMTLNRGFW